MKKLTGVAAVVILLFNSGIKNKIGITDAFPKKGGHFFKKIKKFQSF